MGDGCRGVTLKHVAGPGAALAAAVVALVAAPSARAVIGGTPVRPADVPWFVQLAECGGALVAPDRVVTAAHCLRGLTARQVRAVRLADGQRRRVVRLAFHPDWVRFDGRDEHRALYTDIAVLQLEAPVRLRPLALPVRSRPRVGARVRVVGSGDSRVPPARGPGGLRRADLRVVSDRACAAAYRRAGRAYRGAFHAPTMICAGDRDRRAPYRSPCYRDSGGPLAARSARGWRLVGVVSWAKDCGAEGHPAVFADATAFSTFLRAPVWAPVAVNAPAVIRGEPRVGATLTCVAPGWEVAPERVEYGWTSERGRDRAVRQRGEAADYVVQAADAGRTLRCAPFGTTAGGWDYPAPAVVDIPA
jgi:hypothetical protein